MGEKTVLMGCGDRGCNAEIEDGVAGDVDAVGGGGGNGGGDAG